jgi:putative ABC transport system substrate-binding protein
MKRREFITLLGGAVAAWPVEASGQQPGKLPTIGFLGADASAFSAWSTAFVAHLRKLGWVENQNVATCLFPNASRRR